MFDCLYKWLGIPPEEQPPNHYRLLGIGLFESDADVIDAAADKQLLFLHDLVNGEYGELAEELSNQICAVRLLLLSADKKQAYDRTLQSQRDSSEKPVQAGPSIAGNVGSNGPPAVQVPATVASSKQPQVRLRARPQTGNSPRRRAKRVSWGGRTIKLSICSGLTVLLLLGFAIATGRLVIDFASLGGLYGKPEKPASEPTAERSSRKLENRRSVLKQDMKDDEAARTTEQEQVPQEAVEDETTKPSIFGGLTSGLVRRPSDEQLAEQIDRIRKQTTNEWKVAQEEDRRLEFARAIFRMGVKEKTNFVARYAYLQLAHQLMLQQEDYDSAFGVLDSIESNFSGFDARQLKIDAIKQTIVLLPPERLDMLFMSICEVVEESAEDQEFAAAKSLCDTTRTKLLLSQEDIETIDQLRLDIEDISEAFVEKTKAEQLLETVPKNPEALGRIGAYLCLYQHQWEDGLAMLSKGVDGYSGAASREVIANDSIEAADAWFQLMVNETSRLRKMAIATHTRELYQQILPKSSPSEANVIEKRLKGIERMVKRKHRYQLGDRALAREIGYREFTSKDSKSDRVERQENRFVLGMGRRLDGRGEAIAALELQNASLIKATMEQSKRYVGLITPKSRMGFFVDYHTPGGYEKRVFFSFGKDQGTDFKQPNWGAAGRPDKVVELGWSKQQNLDLEKWSPEHWDGRCWFMIYMKDAGAFYNIKVTLGW